MLNGKNVFGVITLVLLSVSLWTIGSTGAGYSANKADAVATHARCLNNVKKQNERPAPRSGVWPCWHSQLTVSEYQDPWGLVNSLAPPGGYQGGLYLCALAALLLLCLRR